MANDKLQICNDQLFSSPCPLYYKYIGSCFFDTIFGTGGNRGNRVWVVTVFSVPSVASCSMFGWGREAALCLCGEKSGLDAFTLQLAACAEWFFGPRMKLDFSGQKPGVLHGPDRRKTRDSWFALVRGGAQPAVLCPFARTLPHACQRRTRWGAATAKLPKNTHHDARDMIVYMRIEFKRDSWPSVGKYGSIASHRKVVLTAYSIYSPIGRM